MNLSPEEQRAALAALRWAWDKLPQGLGLPAFRLAERIEREGFGIGAHVFRLELPFQGDALALARPVHRERAKLRKQLGVKRLPAGMGPPLVERPYAPTMNEYANLRTFEKDKLRKAIDGVIFGLKARWPAWNMGVRAVGVLRGAGKKQRAGVDLVGGRRRVAVVTRFSSQPVDEISVDILGGKMLIDRLVAAHVLRGDDAEWLARVPRWKLAAPEEGRVVVDVHEIEPLTVPEGTP
ncbi:MAG: hypothetical protein EKK55_05555 [Rhodocyclaceae bacterium]|nr:MAG: hypothetical protein EKK55_05555 [Rhodocyclaceae bacterium]